MARMLRSAAIFACAATVLSHSAPSHAANPPWYNATTTRGFQPDIADFYQHQKWGPTGAATGPAGQAETTWQRKFNTTAAEWRWGGWCRIATYEDACYSLKRAGYAGMMPNAVTANNTWLDTANDEVRALATHTFTGGKGINEWVKTKGHAQWWFTGLVYYYYVYFPDKWYDTTAGAPATGFHYRSSDGSWKKLQDQVLPPAPPPAPPTYIAEKVFDRYKNEFLAGNKVILLLRTTPYVAANFDGSIWWRGSGGGNFHNVLSAGIDVNNRRICFADPDSNKGNTIDRAGINIGASLDPPGSDPAVDARKYQPWTGAGDGIPVPTPNPTQPGDPLFYDAYYNCVTIEDDAQGRKFSNVAANERYKNVVINQLEIIAPVLCARVLPPPPEGGDPTPAPALQHVFGIKGGPLNSTDDVWFFPVAIIDWKEPVTFDMPGWLVVPVAPGEADPMGNSSSFGGIHLQKISGSPITAADLAQLSFSTVSPYDGVKYDVIFRDFEDQTIYRPQVYGVIEGGVGETAEQQATEGLTQSACLADISGDGTVNVTDLLMVITAWGQTDVAADITGGGVNVSDLLAVITAWGPCP